MGVLQTYVMGYMCDKFLKSEDLKNPYEQFKSVRFTLGTLIFCSRTPRVTNCISEEMELMCFSMS